MENKIFAVRTTIGQEKGVADMMSARSEKSEKEAIKDIIKRLKTIEVEVTEEVAKQILNTEGEKEPVKKIFEILKNAGILVEEGKLEKASIPDAFTKKFHLYSVLVPYDIRGYIMVEAVNKTEIDKSLKGVSHARGVVDKGEIAFGDIEKFFKPKPLVTKVETGDIVELISGPFKGEKARVVRIDIKKEEITVELFEAMVPIPVTIRGDIIKVIGKEEKSEASG